MLQIKSTETTVSIVADLSEDLHKQIQEFLDANRTWDCNSFFNAAVKTYLAGAGNE